MSTSSVRVAVVLSSAAVNVDPMHTGLFGWPGWIVMAVVVSWLIVSGRLHISTSSVGMPRRSPAGS